MLENVVDFLDEKSFDFNIKESRKTRVKFNKKFYQPKDDTSKNIETIDLELNIEREDMKEEIKENVELIDDKYYIDKYKSGQDYNKVKNKGNLKNTAINLSKVFKKDGIFIELGSNSKLVVMKDFNLNNKVGKIKSNFTLRCVLGQYDLKSSMLVNSNFGMIKSEFAKWVNSVVQNYDVESMFQKHVLNVLEDYKKDENLGKYVHNLETRLFHTLKKPTKQPKGFLDKVTNIVDLWVQESKEIFYIEQVENQLNFKTYEQSFPLARSMKRKFSIFVGKTNSGKTHAAMNELAAAKNGVYLAPLRLMAQEGQDSLLERKVLTSLVTGEEQKKFNGATHVSSTVEMCNLANIVDVAVIDEIQMIADESRGWAWSQALIGVPAKHVILVGSEESLPYILPVIKNLGEEYEIKRFERKTPLHIRDALWKLKELREGDCVVVFSRKSALEMKNAIEATGKRCSVIYGNLSPDVRRSEANKFKSGENPILVATDAIGMGLNLPISRIFFSTLEKFDGIDTRYLNVSEIKQIAGRAGRYGFAEFGEVGLLFNDKSEDKSILHKAIYGEYDKVTDSRISIAPNLKQIETICNIIGKQDLYAALIFFKEKMVKNHELYKTAILEDMIEIAGMIKTKNLDLATGLSYSCVPIDTNSEVHTKHFFKWINNHIQNKTNDGPVLPDVVTEEKNDSYSLYEAENYVKLSMAYRWLHYKFPEIYIDIENIIENVKTTNNYIEKTLNHHIVISQNKNKFRRGK